MKPRGEQLPPCRACSIALRRSAAIDSTICMSGWTKTVRPSATYTNRLNAEQIAEYGYADPDPRLFEEDHLIALELESSLHRDVCSGSMTLSTAPGGILYPCWIPTVVPPAVDLRRGASRAAAVTVARRS